MITNPKAGWCDFCIGTDDNEFYGHPSYLTDVPLELLNCFISYYENGAGACFFDSEEEGRFTLVLSDGDVLMIEPCDARRNKVSSKVSPKLFYKITVINEHIPNLANELLTDIAKEFAEWLRWTPEAFDENCSIERRRMDLEQACYKLNKYLSEYL